MDFVTRGFEGRRRSSDDRLPPGQYLTGDFPVLSAGPTHGIDHDEWALWTAADFALVHSYGGYTTNLPLEDLLDGQAWVAYGYDGDDLPAEHGGPARLLVPHLYFWKSAKWVRGIELMLEDSPGFWEQLGYHDYGDPWREQRYQGD